MVYPAVYTIVRSFFGQTGFLGHWVGIDNYKTLFTTSTLTTAIKNNAIWVAVVPALVTADRARLRRAHRARPLGGRVQDGRLPADGDLGVRDRRDLADHVPAGSEPRRDQRARQDGRRRRSARPGVLSSALPSTPALQATRAARSCCKTPIAPGGVALLGADRDPAEPGAQERRAGGGSRRASPVTIDGVVWRDFKPGGGKAGVVEKGELGLPGVTVELRIAPPARRCSRRSRTPTASFDFTKVSAGQLSRGDRRADLREAVRRLRLARAEA